MDVKDEQVVALTRVKKHKKIQLQFIQVSGTFFYSDGDYGCTVLSEVEINVI